MLLPLALELVCLLLQPGLQFAILLSHVCNIFAFDVILCPKFSDLFLKVGNHVMVALLGLFELLLVAEALLLGLGLQSLVLGSHVVGLFGGLFGFVLQELCLLIIQTSDSL